MADTMAHSESGESGAEDDYSIFHHLLSALRETFMEKDRVCRRLAVTASEAEEKAEQLITLDLAFSRAVVQVLSRLTRHVEDKANDLRTALQRQEAEIARIGRGLSDLVCISEEANSSTTVDGVAVPVPPAESALIGPDGNAFLCPCGSCAAKRNVQRWITEQVHLSHTRRPVDTRAEQEVRPAERARRVIRPAERARRMTRILQLADLEPFDPETGLATDGPSFTDGQIEVHGGDPPSDEETGTEGGGEEEDPLA